MAVNFKKALPHVICILIILVSTSIYYSHQFKGETIAGSDVISSTAWSKQVQDYQKETGVLSNWNPSMFSGMPWGLLTAGHQYNLVKHVDKVFRAGIAPPMSLAFKASILCYLSLILLGLSPWVSLIGALAFGFNTNYVILLEAGHQSKLSVIADFPLILSGFILCFRKKWRIGMIAISVGTSLAIINNHVQMVYYLLIAFIVIGIAFFIDAARKKELPIFLKMAGFAVVAAALGGLSNYSVLQSALNFSEDTMRGKPILASERSVAQSSSNTQGLEWNYAMQWSNTSGDLMSVAIPRFVGGSSYEEVDASSDIGRLLRQNNAVRGSDNTYQASMYWGNLPFTSGPYYSSIILVGLSLLSFLVLPVRLRWAFGAASITILLLSMGKHASWFNKVLFDFSPFFNKFRAPSSAINLLPLVMVFAGAMTLQQIISSENRNKYLKPSLYVVGSLILLILIMTLFGASSFSFESPRDANYADQIKDLFREGRIDSFKSDGYRSALFLSLFLGAIVLYVKNIIKPKYAFIGIVGVLILMDLYPVNLRHLDQDNWESKTEYDSNFNRRPVDDQIIQSEPKGRGYYRVLDIPNFTSAVGSYHHNTIGGYHAAKLQRYDDMITYHLGKGTQGVFNMLNAKYTITASDEVRQNPRALGNAWCVSSVQVVESPNEEIESLTNLNTETTAVVLASEFPNVNLKTGSCGGQISMTDYKLNHWTYDFSSATDEIVIFSEIWYEQNKGLIAKIDGLEVDFFRANYILRGLRVPSGNHKVEFIYKAPIKGAGISLVSSLLILGLVLYTVLGYLKLLPASMAFEYAQDESLNEKSEVVVKKKKTKKKKIKKPKS